MAIRQEFFIKGSDNVISTTLTENAVTIAVTWTQVDVIVGPLTITRTVDENGVAFAAGVVDITPSGLTESLTSLIDGYNYRVFFRVYTAGEPNGVLYGADDSNASIYFLVS